MEVSLRDPEFATSSLRDLFSSVTYKLTYWKDGDEKNVSGLRLRAARSQQMCGSAVFSASPTSSIDCFCLFVFV